MAKQAEKKLTGRGGPGRGQGRKPGNTQIASPEARRHIADKAREHAEAALETLVELLGAESEQVRLNAANSILDRGFGKVPQAADLGGGEDDPQATTDAFASFVNVLNEISNKRAVKESDKA